MILIISFVDNAHVTRVTEHLKRPWRLVSTEWFPSAMQLTMAVGGSADSLRLLPPGEEPILMEEVGAIWYRRIRALELDSMLSDPVSRLFAWSESTEALGGAWAATDAFWMNNPYADEKAQRKMWQLKEANDLGLAIPDTLITSCPEDAREFIHKYGPEQVVRKAFRNISEAPRDTTRLTEADCARLDSVRYAPVTFQRYIHADFDLRTTIVDGEMFTAAIRSEPEFAADYRRGLRTATVTPYRLPDDVAEKLLALMERLNLAFGAADLRVTPEGEHVFLEVNPAGEYLFACDRTGQQVPQAIAACLERRDRCD
jgi:hypothetical protein